MYNIITSGCRDAPPCYVLRSLRLVVYQFYFIAAIVAFILFYFADKILFLILLSRFHPFTGHEGP